MPSPQIRAWMNNVPPTVSPTESVGRARVLSQTTPATEILVIDHGDIVGMLNESDIWGHCPMSTIMIEEQQISIRLDQFHVSAMMALHPPVIASDAELADAAGLLAASGRRGLAVVDDGMPMGFVSEAALLHAAAVLLKSNRETNGVWR